MKSPRLKVKAVWGILTDEKSSAEDQGCLGDFDRWLAIHVFGE
jgi:hypothetical protein